MLQVERPSRQAPIERLAVEQLHREIELALVLVEAVDGADVRMIEATTRCALRAGTARPLRRSAVLPVGSTFSATCRPSLSVLGAIHDAHPARAELVEDLVVPEGLSNQRIRHGADDHPIRL